MNQHEDETTQDGPIEGYPWPDRLTAHVVEPGPAPRLHGYDVQDDLARSYRFSDLVYLSLAGELPDTDASRRVEVVLAFLCPCSIAEAPTHAAALARVCDASTEGVLQVGAIALAEQASFEIASLAPLAGWLNAPDEAFPETLRARSADERDAVGRLRQALGPGHATVRGLDQDPCLAAALACTLHAAGLTTPEAWVTLLVLARLPALAAEAFAATPGDLKGYPMDLPHFAYEGRRDDP